MNAKPCGLISCIPPALQKEWAQNLALFARRFRPAALILKQPAQDVLERILEKARPIELAILVTDSIATACNSGASGVYFPVYGGNVKKARDELGSSAVIGAFCGLSRHAAMECAEAGADFIAFDATRAEALDTCADLSFWWDEVTGIPVALALGTLRPNASVLSKARPDFLLAEETDCAGESLTFATEFGFQSQT